MLCGLATDSWCFSLQLDVASTSGSNCITASLTVDVPFYHSSLTLQYLASKVELIITRNEMNQYDEYINM